MSATEKTNREDPAEIEERLRASREALAADVDALAARFSPKEQAKQAGMRARSRIQETFSPLVEQAEGGLRGATAMVRRAQDGDGEAQRLVGAAVGSAAVLLAALAIGTRLARH
ncbi:DUF3618 domain-containing protein [Actinomyces trachealis]|uniref:DUF3618 domain-containing protein n=1 Tax=Actinomyces trachealis TaxID=2763540 RepID=UPI001892B9CB|nr:DUF3618 domain-containing protein [Actinomyces trachealis]